MAVRLFLCAAYVLAFTPVAFAQTAPLPGMWTGDTDGFLSRAEFFLALAPMKSGDARFAWDQRNRVDIDLLRYPNGRVNLLVDVQLVMGRERREFDLNHQHIIMETSTSNHVGPIDVGVVFHHHSAHLVDRPSDRVVAWHTLGARGGHVFAGPQSTVAVDVEWLAAVQHTFVDYDWTSQLTVRYERTLARARRAFALGSGGFIGVDHTVPDRERQTGARAEGGVHFPVQRAAIDLFAAYERRIDGYPTSRVPSRWLEGGFRLATR
jgi:hypothetical protein